MIKLNIGCGSDHQADFVNLDISPDVGADIVHDLDVAPWPLHDGTVAIIVAQDVFEHVDDPLLFMRESHRILGTDGLLLIKSPHWQHRDAYTDPTHRRFCTEHTWDYWIAGTALHALHNAAYGGFAFERITQDIRQGAIFIALKKR